MPPREPDRRTPPPSPAPRAGLQLMALILAAFALISLYSNYQKAHISRIEKVTIAPAPPPLPAPAAKSSPRADEP